MRIKRCFFCGNEFKGQKLNFEHIVPQWLVKEADLNRRKTFVTTASKRFEMTMGRIGGKVCEKCNLEGSSLEGRAHIVFNKLKNGICLTEEDGRSFLDWMDKLRVGIWLWILSAHGQQPPVEPKFHINTRTAYKDRIVIVSKYTEGPRGLEFLGMSDIFLWAPSVGGFHINNFVFISISSDFFVSRHLVSLKQNRFFNGSGLERFEIDLSPVPSPRVTFLGNPYILAQCIMPADVFQEIGIEMTSQSLALPHLGEGPVLKLDGLLKRTEGGLGCPPTRPTTGKPHAYLMNINLHKTNEFILEDFLASDFSEVTDLNYKKSVQSLARKFLTRERASIVAEEHNYFRTSGVKLPSSAKWNG